MCRLSSPRSGTGSVGQGSSSSLSYESLVPSGSQSVPDLLGNRRRKDYTIRRKGSLSQEFRPSFRRVCRLHLVPVGKTLPYDDKYYTLTPGQFPTTKRGRRRRRVKTVPKVNRRTSPGRTPGVKFDVRIDLRGPPLISRLLPPPTSDSGELTLLTLHDTHTRLSLWNGTNLNSPRSPVDPPLRVSLLSPLPTPSSYIPGTRPPTRRDGAQTKDHPTYVFDHVP